MIKIKKMYKNILTQSYKISIKKFLNKNDIIKYTSTEKRI